MKISRVLTFVSVLLPVDCGSDFKMTLPDRTNGKRARSSDLPAAKRRAVSVDNQQPNGRATRQRSAPPRPVTKTIVHHALRPLLNPLPTAPEHKRPALTLFGWGSGAFNQLGLGPISGSPINSWNKPKRNPLVERMVEEGEFGSDGAGLEAIAAGGMHTLVIDEKGTVSDFSLLFSVVECAILKSLLGVVFWY